MPTTKPRNFRSLQPTPIAPRRLDLVRPRPMSSSAEPAIFYCRPAGPFVDEDAQLELLETRLPGAPRIHRVTLEELDDRWRAWVSAELPSLIVIREGRVVAGAMGRLPARELEDVVRRALA